MASQTDEEERTLTCAGCDRRLEWCSFCDEADCAVARCYHCTAVELGESAPKIHTHGG